MSDELLLRNTAQSRALVQRDVQLTGDKRAVPTGRGDGPRLLRVHGLKACNP